MNYVTSALTSCITTISRALDFMLSGLFILLVLSPSLVLLFSVNLLMLVLYRIYRVVSKHEDFVPKVTTHQ